MDTSRQQQGNASKASEMMNRGPEEYLMPSAAHVRRNDDGSFTPHEFEEPLRAVGGVIECASARCDPKTGIGCVFMEGRSSQGV